MKEKSIRGTTLVKNLVGAGVLRVQPLFCFKPKKGEEVMRLITRKTLLVLVVCAPFSLRGGWWWNFKYELSHKTKKIRAVPRNAKKWIGSTILRLCYHSTVKKLFHTIVQDIQDVARTGESKEGGLKERDFWWRVYKIRTESGGEEVHFVSWDDKTRQSLGKYQYEFSLPYDKECKEGLWRIHIRNALYRHFSVSLKKSVVFRSPTFFDQVGV